VACLWYPAIYPNSSDVCLKDCRESHAVYGDRMSLNPYWNAIEKARIRWWHWLYLWILPTYVIFDEATIVYYKVFRGAIYITKEELAPWMKP
jgi:hypothetical protein